MISKRRSKLRILGLNPMSDGKLIRIPNSRTYRRSAKKTSSSMLRKIAEEFRVGVRNHRRDANDMLKNSQGQVGD